MAEVNQSKEPILASDRGAFKAVVEAVASRDPKRVLMAENDAITALGSIGSMLNVVADYIYIRNQNPKASLYATDLDVADAVYSLSDLLSVQQSALIEASNARFDLNEQRANKEKTHKNPSKEG